MDGIALFSLLKRPPCLVDTLLSLRTLFLKEELSEIETASLMSIAQSLLQIAAQWNPLQLENSPVCRALEPAARRFLVVDSLWNISLVLGPKINKAQWWGRLMTHVALPQKIVSYPAFPYVYADMRLFLASLHKTLEEFRHQRRPSAEVIVAVKRMIFCDARFRTRFRNHVWGPWRSDDEEYRRLTGERGKESGKASDSG